MTLNTRIIQDSQNDIEKSMNERIKALCPHLAAEFKKTFQVTTRTAHFATLIQALSIFHYGFPMGSSQFERTISPKFKHILDTSMDSLTLINAMTVDYMNEWFETHKECNICAKARYNDSTNNDQACENIHPVNNE